MDEMLKKIEKIKWFKLTIWKLRANITVWRSF